MLSHCPSTDTHTDRNPWIIRSGNNSDYPSADMQLHSVRLFLMTEIRKNIGMESIFSTIMLVI